MSVQSEQPSFRAVLGRFPSGVVVVTALGSDGPLGLTCQSFSALSIDPPLVMFAVARTSVTWPEIRKVGHFSINVLSDHHADVSARFARSGGSKFDGLYWLNGPRSHPIIPESTAWIDCELHDEYEGGDHLIVIGRVVNLDIPEERLPLVYLSGSYMTVTNLTRMEDQ